MFLEEDSKVSEFKRLIHEGEKKELCRGSGRDEASVSLEVAMLGSGVMHPIKIAKIAKRYSTTTLMATPQQ